jgi:hypothetical protein
LELAQVLQRVRQPYHLLVPPLPVLGNLETRHHLTPEYSQNDLLPLVLG